MEPGLQIATITGYSFNKDNMTIALSCDNEQIFHTVPISIAQIMLASWEFIHPNQLIGTALLAKIVSQ
jgi:hypothetical protein